MASACSRAGTIVSAVRRASESDSVTMEELRHMAERRFGDMVKGVVDLRRGVLLLDADMHADQESALLAGSNSIR